LVLLSESGHGKKSSPALHKPAYPDDEKESSSPDFRT
jgi:hypothetical protein